MQAIKSGSNGTTIRDTSRLLLKKHNMCSLYHKPVFLKAFWHFTRKVRNLPFPRLYDKTLYYIPLKCVIVIWFIQIENKSTLSRSVSSLVTATSSTWPKSCICTSSILTRLASSPNTCQIMQFIFKMLHYVLQYWCRTTSNVLHHQERNFLKFFPSAVLCSIITWTQFHNNQKIS